MTAFYTNFIRYDEPLQRRALMKARSMDMNSGMRADLKVMTVKDAYMLMITVLRRTYPEKSSLIRAASNAFR